MSQSGNNIKISGNIDNARELQDALRGHVEIVAYDPGQKRIIGAAKIENNTFTIVSKTNLERIEKEIIVAIVPDSQNTIAVKRIIESGNSIFQTIPLSVLKKKKGQIGAEDLKFEVTNSRIQSLIDLFFRYVRVCGRVVKKNFKTGDICPVPGARVKIFDIDFNFLRWCPLDWDLFCWIYPFFIRRELLAEVTTDACGNFCIFVPRYELDVIVRWRKRIMCTPDFYLPIKWKDIIQKPPKIIGTTPIGPIGPDPPDPVINTKIGNMRSVNTSKLVMKTASPFSIRAEMLGQENLNTDILSTKLFPENLPAPKDLDIQVLSQRVTDEAHIKEILSRRPLIRWRCFPIYEPEFDLYLDVPDLAFEVTQMIDGTEHIIYETGIFDVMWDLSGDIGNIELDANEIAYCNPFCDFIPPTCTSSGLVGVGVLPINPTFIDPDGNARRANRPKPLIDPLHPEFGTVSARPDAKSPFCSELFIYGCPDLEASAKFYKIYYQKDGDPVEHTFIESWSMWKIDTTEIITVVSDVGFYPILSPSDNFFPFHLVLDWPTNSYPNGKYRLQIELFDTSKASLGRKDNVYLTVDNSQPTILIPEGIIITGNMGTNVTFVPGVDPHCLVVNRKAGETLTVTVRVNISSTNLRDYTAALSWCDGSVAADITSLGTNHPWSPSTYWHQSVTDNSVNHLLKFVIPPAASPGGFYLYIQANARTQRALEGLYASWYVDPVYVYTPFTYPFAIIDI